MSELGVYSSTLYMSELGVYSSTLYMSDTGQHLYGDVLHTLY